MRRLTYILIFVGIFSLQATSQSCLPDGICFSTQAQIDSFQVNYPGCIEIDGDVTISGDDITNLNGLNILTSFNGNLLISENNSLISLEGLENVRSIGGQLSVNHFALIISRNDALVDMSGLNGLNWIGGGLHLFRNQSLTDLVGIDSLTTIGGDLWLESNNYLTALTGLESLISIGGSLVIDGYNGLESLAALENLTSLSGNLTITHTELHNLSGLEGLTFIPGNVLIASNGDLIDLTGLNNMIYIGGDLEIGNFAGTTNYALESLSGLNNITSIGGKLNVQRNGKLSNLNGLDNLQSVGGYLRIYKNETLTSLDGLESLTSIGGLIQIYKNDSLLNISALAALNTINGSLQIIDNPSLKSLDGLENLNPESITHLRIKSNSSLSSCEAQSICNYLSQPNGTVEIYENDDGCNTPSEVAESCGILLPCLPFGNYYFLSQSDLDSFPSNFPDCSDLYGDIYILSNDITSNDITNLDGLSQVTSISRSLFIQDNMYLTSLTGLEHLLSIGKYLMIGDNYYLSTLTGLDNLGVGSLSILYIRDNFSLSHCEVEGICNILSSGIENISIHNNAPGCDSREEVEEACETVSVPEINSISGFSIFPIPAHKELIISGSQVGNITGINIFNMIGILVLHQSFEGSVDVSSLPLGIYLLEIRTNNTSFRTKIIIY